MSNIYKIFENLKKNPQNQKLNDKILLIDGLNMFIRVWANVPDVNDEGELYGGVTGFLKSLGYTVRTLNPTRVFIVFDGKSSTKKRKSILPTYKEGRGQIKQNVNRLNESVSEEDPTASMKRQTLALLRYLETLPVTMISMEGLEADDIIAYLNKQVFTGTHCVISSTDKDFLQLVDENTQVWNPKKKVLYDEKTVYDEIGIHPQSYMMYKLFMGDKSDNISGISGIGDKTYKKVDVLNQTQVLLPEQVLKYCEDGLIDEKIASKITSQKDILERNYQLMQLHDIDISAQKASTLRKIALEDPITTTNLAEFKKNLLFDKLYDSFKFPVKWITENFTRLNGYASEFNKKLSK